MYFDVQLTTEEDKRKREDKQIAGPYRTVPLSKKGAVWTED